MPDAVKRPRSFLLAAALVALALAAASVAPGCGLAKRIGVGFVYDRAALPEANVRRGLAYVEGSADPKHRLNLFLPLADSVRGGPWPTVVFVHGGNWDSGDRDFTFGGADLYNNVGRFFAARGIGAAVVSYRLLPTVRWEQQIEDVARAVAWAHRNVGAYGGDPRALFVMGHSAGGQLVARVALDPAPLRRQGLSTDVLCGAMPVSGAGYDLTDVESYRIAENFDFYASRFGTPETPLTELPPAETFAWQAAASPTTFVRRDAPPFLLLYAGGDYPALRRQAHLLDDALRAAGARSRIVVVPGQSHTRIVPTLSRDDRTAGPALLAFVREQACG